MEHYSYKGFIPTLAREYSSAVESIRAEYGYELGAEYENILCTLLHRLLPRQYGVCRGYLTNSEGTIAGDDIIIFDHARFPTVALRNENDFSRKEYIPIEAACCYIEAKYAINILGDDGQSLAKAHSQVRAAKELCSQRATVPLNAVTQHMNADGFTVTVPAGWPALRNPLFTAIIASRIRKRQGDKSLLTPVQASELIMANSSVDQNGPDLCVFGPQLLGLPVIKDENDFNNIQSPFYIHGKTHMMLLSLRQEFAFAVGLVQLLWALDWIQLGKIPWSQVIRNFISLDKS